MVDHPINHIEAALNELDAEIKHSVRQVEELNADIAILKRQQSVFTKAYKADRQLENKEKHDGRGPG